MKAERLQGSFYEKVWGATRLSPWFPDSNGKIGEVWYHQKDIPLLLKFIFTTERLSVQVHPDDDYARVHENSAGKTEMWHILRAEPGASIALGFHETLSPDRLREVSLSGEIEHLLNWVPVKPGDTYFVPAGVVHAIGAGIALCEIQQYSDVTYRLYDYGRPRELHLDHAVTVAHPEPHPGAVTPAVTQPGVERLVCCQYFVTDRISTAGLREVATGSEKAEYWMIMQGSLAIEGQPAVPGEVWRISPGTIPVEGDATFLRTYAP